MPALERLIGPVAYRGRQTMVQKKTTSLNKSTVSKSNRTPVADLNLSQRETFQPIQLQVNVRPILVLVGQVSDGVNETNASQYS